MIVCAVISIGFLVFIHEGGHYLAARAFGVRVTEFMLGLPGPSIGFTKGETRYGVTAVPLGGYAKVCGMEAGPLQPHLQEALASLYRRGIANMEDVARDCGISDDEAYNALEELVEWGSVIGPSKADQYNTYRAPRVCAWQARSEEGGRRGSAGTRQPMSWAKPERWPTPMRSLRIGVPSAVPLAALLEALGHSSGGHFHEPAVRHARVRCGVLRSSAFRCSTPRPARSRPSTPRCCRRCRPASCTSAW